MLKPSGIVGVFALVTLLVSALPLAGCGGGSSGSKGGGSDSGTGAETAAGDSGVLDSTAPADSGGSDVTVADSSPSEDSSSPPDSSPPEDSAVDDSAVPPDAPGDTAVADTSVAADTSASDTGATEAGGGDASDGSFTDASFDGGVFDVTVSYTIGGTVSGLTGGATLVLQDNAGDNLTVNNGAFTFPTALMTGHTYAVTILTQPAGGAETCTVSAGSGSVTASNITSVSIVCTQAAFTVGGTITGLAGADSVVLQDNGGNNLSVSANGSFTFSASVSSGAPYAVTVFTQPSSPVQSCVVTAGTGTVAASNVTSVVVNCASSSFTVGGAVTGLAFGNSLALQDNGGDMVFVTQNGGFAFPTPVASGASYAVTVAFNPVTPVPQTCTVTNGSGTVAGANVTSVTVSCTTVYTVGGAVTGLAGGASVVLSNAGHAFTVTGDGTGNQTFTFSATQLNGSAYAVTVTTPPAGQTCYVANGSGTINAANVTNVIVRCRGNLVAYYPFDEGSGTVMTDVAGTNNGTHNATYIAGVSGKALSFNGVNQGGIVNGNASFTWGANNAAYTVDYWLFTNAVQSNWVTIFHKSDMGGGNCCSDYQRSPAEWFCPGSLVIHTPMATTANGNDVAICSTPALTTGTWYHFAAVHDPTIGANGSEVVYINGSVVATLALSGPTVGGQGILYLANDTLNDYDLLNGALDEVRVYSVALTQAQVQLDMQ